MPHTCHAWDCNTRCAPKFLMCPRHWRMVPELLQALVWKSFNPAQCADVKDRPAPTGAWHIAADACIIAVWLQEKRGRDIPEEMLLTRATKTMRLAAQHAHQLGEDWRAQLLEVHRRAVRCSPLLARAVVGVMRVTREKRHG